MPGGDGGEKQIFDFNALPHLFLYIYTYTDSLSLFVVRTKRKCYN